MQYLLLGFAALLALLLLMRVYSLANTQVLARQLRIGAGVAALAGAGVLVYRGAIGYAMSLAALGSWLLWGMGGSPWGAGSAQKASGQTSRVETEHLEVELDHDTGQIRGRVLKGFFAGRDLETLAPVEMAHLWQDCRFSDPQSAQILEAYLDRAHPTWREDLARAEGESSGPAGHMTRAQALDILGLSEGASDDDIRRAHRDFMLKLHPDRGGSTFLAAKINEAKDVLLGK
ncbi:MAG: DnaJ domain-containing protein [Hyphomonadaceae bacterium]|nr:DnaJ domain-containing protein [Hyphomonadaceae bacterium]